MRNKASVIPVDLSAGCSDYLRVDAFLETLPAVRILSTALKIGLIDAVGESSLTYGELRKRRYCPERSLEFLVSLLLNANVLEEADGGIAWSAEFRQAMRYRDLLESKVDFTLLIVKDFAQLCTELLTDMPTFMSKSHLMEIFDYGKCTQSTPANYADTARWMRYTTALTRYETQACLEAYDFSSHHRVLDIGGNSGEFMRQMCVTHTKIAATVADLPVVCDVGQSHVSSTAQADQIQFQRGDAFTAPFADGYDLITFKSMLHDWPDEKARYLIAKACDHLPSGGSILVYERSPIDFARTGLPCSLLPIALFFSFYRNPDFYIDILYERGLTNIKIREFELDTGFFVVTGTKA